MGFEPGKLHSYIAMIPLFLRSYSGEFALTLMVFTIMME